MVKYTIPRVSSCAIFTIIYIYPLTRMFMFLGGIIIAILKWHKSNWFELISLVIAVIGGSFALYQWKKSNTYKKGDIVESLIKTINDDQDIATIMDLCDWNDGFIYNGKFSISKAASRSDLVGMSSEELFKKIDRTLAHSHIFVI